MLGAIEVVRPPIGYGGDLREREKQLGFPASQIQAPDSGLGGRRVVGIGIG